LIGTKLTRTTADQQLDPHSFDIHMLSTARGLRATATGDLIAHIPDVDGILVRFLMRTHGRRKMAVVIDALIEGLDLLPGGLSQDQTI
jgi:hypothetical protein